jgi:hypothetical protein
MSRAALTDGSNSARGIEPCAIQRPDAASQKKRLRALADLLSVLTLSRSQHPCPAGRSRYFRRRFETVRTRTRMSRVRSSAATRRMNSDPDILGRSRTRRINCGRTCLRLEYRPVPNRKFNPVSPSRTILIGFASLARPNARAVSAAALWWCSTSKISRTSFGTNPESMRGAVADGSAACARRCPMVIWSVLDRFAAVRRVTLRLPRSMSARYVRWMPALHASSSCVTPSR